MRHTPEQITNLSPFERLKSGFVAFLPILIIILGIIFSLYLQFLIPQDVFFSGDGGLKALLTKQLASGVWKFDLVPPSAQWVQELWENGLFPYEPPFVYFVNKRYFITFPYTFPLVTAPFYSLLGYRGLYVIPLCSVWIIWLNFYWICHRFSLSLWVTCMGLIGLIFGSNLTLYSAMYWEHTIAIALAFQGIAILTTLSRTENHPNIKKVLSGFLIGLSIWFRPELFCLVGLLLSLCLLKVFMQKNKGILSRLNPLLIQLNLRRSNIFFIVPLSLTILLFFLSNQLIYGKFTGIHAVQVVEKFSFLEKWVTSYHNTLDLTIGKASLLGYVPISIYSSICFLKHILSSEKSSYQKAMTSIYFVSLLFLFAVVFMIPGGAGGKQWGPRFLLIMVPVLHLLAARELDVIVQRTSPMIKLQVWKFTNIFLVTVLIFTGIYKNSVLGVNFLVKNYRDILPAVEFIKQQPESIVAVSHQFVGQTLEASVGEKYIFFKVEDQSNLILLSGQLAEQNQSSFIYICYLRACKLPDSMPEKFYFTRNNLFFNLSFNKLGNFGKYEIYRTAILQSDMSIS